MSEFRTWLGSIGKGTWAVLGALSAGPAGSVAFWQFHLESRCRETNGCSYAIVPSAIVRCNECANSGQAGVAFIAIVVVAGAISVAGFFGLFQF